MCTKNFLLVEQAAKGGSRDTGERFRMLYHLHRGRGRWVRLCSGKCQRCFQQTGIPRDRVRMLCNTIFAAAQVFLRCRLEHTQIRATPLQSRRETTPYCQQPAFRVSSSHHWSSPSHLPACKHPSQPPTSRSTVCDHLHNYNTDITIRTNQRVCCR
jgi:hypothetical protein